MFLKLVFFSGALCQGQSKKNASLEQKDTHPSTPRRKGKKKGY
jgi:hypothetical protein